jgi:drug/metabolite transporter (DMT)-like permease
MPVWILIVIVAQFLNAVVAIIDKHIVTDEKVPQPISYAFYVGILSTLSLVIFFFSFIPLDFGSISFPHIKQVALPSLKLTLLSLLAGYTFITALFFLYTSFKRADASDVVPVVGSTNAVITFIISFIFIGEVLTDNFVLGFTFLIMSMVILSHFRFTGKILACAILSGFFSAIYFVSMKIMFNDFAFDQAFFWSRIGILLAALTILLIPFFRRGIFSGFKKGNAKNIFWVIGNSVLGGIAGIALLKATELGSVSVVQVMGGLQFTFLVIFSILFGRVTPTTFGENNNINDIIQKVVSVSFIVIGFYLLFR